MAVRVFRWVCMKQSHYQKSVSQDPKTPIYEWRKIFEQMP
jgi:hypothetical protein